MVLPVNVPRFSSVSAEAPTNVNRWSISKSALAYVVFVSGGTCQEHVQSPSTLKNFAVPVSPVEASSVPSKLQVIVEE